MVARDVDRSLSNGTRAAGELSGASSRPTGPASTLPFQASAQNDLRATPTSLTPVALAPSLTSRAALPSDVAQIDPSPAIPERGAVATPAASRQLRLAIVDFDYAPVYSGVSGKFGTNVDIGKGVADLLLTYLVKDGNYVVIERAVVDRILEEQNFSNSDRADPNSAARIGKLLGVDAIIMGSITQFGSDTKTTGVGGVGGALGRVGIGGVGQRQSKAIVGLTARIVSVETGDVLAVAEALGESKRTSTSLTGGGAGWREFGAGNVNLGSSEFQSTIIGEATKAAVEKMTTQVIVGRDRVAVRQVTVQGLVAAVAGGQVFLDVGSRAGLKAGDQMSVERPGQEIKDRATGKVIRQITTPVGVIRLVDVDTDSAIGEVVSGSGFQVKDIVTKK